jgi:hypothetical protein
MSRVDDDEKGVRSIYTLGGLQDLWCVNEPGLYSLILGSKKPEAKPFKRWVTHEVLPSLRRTGTYSLLQQRLADVYLCAAPQENQPRIPHELFAELKRLYRFKFPSRPHHRPPYLGVFVRRYVYNPIVPPELWEELDRRTPLDLTFRRQTPLHCWLSSDYGQGRLSAQLTLVLALLRASATWTEFVRLYAGAQSHGSQLSMYPAEVAHGCVPPTH